MTPLTYDHQFEPLVEARPGASCWVGVDVGSTEAMNVQFKFTSWSATGAGGAGHSKDVSRGRT
jgi:methyl coenzyme M reductase beta subunit